MVWANFLHFYQPPTQKKYWVDRVTNESYRRLVNELLANPQVKLTLNVNTVLCDLWLQYGHKDVIDGIKTLVQRGQIELTGSAKFHPLLPKMPKEEIKRQIKLNEEGIYNYFGVLPPASRSVIPGASGGTVRQPPSTGDPVGPRSGQGHGKCLSLSPGDSLRHLRGFFPPEMAYDRYVAEVVAEMGYEWVIAEELSYSSKLGQVKYDRIYEVAGIPLKIFFRERNFSWRALSGGISTPELFLRELGARVNHNEYLLTAMDGETFGHHRPGMEKQLFDIYLHSGLTSVTISELPALFSKREEVQTLPSTWALMETEVGINKPFSRWDDPENEIQRLQWELTDLAIGAVAAAGSASQLVSSRHAEAATVVRHKLLQPESQFEEARNLLDRALHSDQYWWASARPWWSLEMIERGAYELLEAIKASRPVPPNDAGAATVCRRGTATAVRDSVIQEAQELYYQIITKGFEWQRTGKVDEISKKEDESVRMLTDSGLGDLPAEELDKMIAVIQKELGAVVQNGEYERAIQLRDRIKELESYKKKENPAASL